MEGQSEQVAHCARVMATSEGSGMILPMTHVDDEVERAVRRIERTVVLEARLERLDAEDRKLVDRLVEVDDGQTTFTELALVEGISRRALDRRRDRIKRAMLMPRRCAGPTCDELLPTYSRSTKRYCSKRCEKAYNRTVSR
jgi:hypothetical protein